MLVIQEFKFMNDRVAAFTDLDDERLNFRSSLIADTEIGPANKTRPPDHKHVFDRYRSSLMRSWRARAVGLFIAASAAAISTSDCRA
jgi:hypothetical protein